MTPRLFEVRDSDGITRGYFSTKVDAKTHRDRLQNEHPKMAFRVSRGPDHAQGKSAVVS